MPALRAQAAALGIAPRVVFAGHRADVPAVLGAIDVFCISSDYEGTPLALFEAMAAGKAIVSTAVDGCREVLEDGATGLLVPPRDPDALAAALGPRRRRRRAPARGLAAHGPRRVRAATISGNACAGWKTSTTRSSRPRRGGPERDRCSASCARRGRPGRCRATSSSAATRSSSRGGALPRGHVPVFVFHSLEPGVLPPQARVPARATATSRSPPSDYFQFLMGTRPGARPRGASSPSTTGAASLWTRRRAAAAALRDDRASSSWSRAGRSRGPARCRRPSTTRAGGAGRARRTATRALLSWEQIEALARSGPFEFQSHTLTHARVHVAPAGRRLRHARSRGAATRRWTCR